MRVVMIDDNPVDRLNLRTLLGLVGEVEIVGEADTLATGCALVESQQPDLIFLDVRLGRETGFQLLERLRGKPRVIFTTLHREYAFPAFEVEAHDFLLKPVGPERLQRALQRAVASLSHAPARPLDLADLLVFRLGDERRVVEVERILAIMGNRDYTRILASPRMDCLDQRRLRDWQELLPAPTFQMLDRSTILNLRQIDSYRQTPEGGVVTLRNHPAPILIGAVAFKRLEALMHQLPASL